tara:strand:- start:489 stop:926 length:438 start_codon:yes stop_codon:yes gene_type:complete
MEINRILDLISRNWGTAFFVVLILYFVFKPEEKRLIIVDRNGHDVEEVTKNDSRVSSIWENGNTFIINNSNSNLYLEEVKYSSTSSFYNSEPRKYTIRMNTTYSTDKYISYIFTNPPSTISVRSGGSTTKWHLHKKHSYNRFDLY